jgi:hypothetical protein
MSTHLPSIKHDKNSTVLSKEEGLAITSTLSTHKQNTRSVVRLWFALYGSSKCTF